MLVLKEGEIAVHCDLEAERQAHRRFFELEIRDTDGAFVAALEELGCECAVNGGRRLKTILPESVEIRDVYRLAAEQGTQIRRLIPKRNTLEDIFLNAMQEKS